MTHVQNTIAKFAKSIANAENKLAKSAAQVAADVTKTCQAVVDTLVTDCGSKARAQYWKENGELISGFVNTAWPHDAQESARRNYKTSLKIAFQYGIEFAPSLFKTHSSKDGKPKGAAKGAKTGTVTKTNDAELVKTLTKALEQARTLKRDDTASGILDLILEVDPEFKE